MRRRRNLAAAALLLTLAGRVLAADEHTDSAAVPRIGVAEFKAAYDKKQVVAVDTRGADAYRAGHVAGAMLIAYGDDMAARADELKKTGKLVVTYCA